MIKGASETKHGEGDGADAEASPSRGMELGDGQHGAS